MRIQEINNEDTNLQNRKAVRKRKLRRRFAVFKAILTIVLTAALLVLLALSPLFNIRSVKVSGNVHYTEDEIKDASGIPLGNNGFKTVGSSPGNLLSLRYGAAEKSITESCPFIKEVKVGFSLPSTMKIVITERKPVGFIQYMGVNLVVDEQGYVLEALKTTEKINLIQIKGVDFNSYKVGQALKMTGNSGFNNAVALIDAVSDADNSDDSIKLMKIIDYIDASNPDKTCMSLDGRILANLGDLQDLKYRLDFLKVILIQNDGQGYLDFTSGKNPCLKPSE